MQWLDWIIVFFPLAVLIGLAVYSKRYARSVSDYLVAGRVAGRYVLSVGDMAAGLAVITFVAGCEQYYQTGFAVAFWGAVSTPITLFIALSGYIVYRWRQTRCLSFGQFLEMRYGSKFFRIFCSLLRTVAEMGANAIGPAIAARFFIYYLELPHSFTVCGISCSTYICLVTVCTALSVFFILQGGRISLLITDCFQGILFFPILMLLVAFILCKFSWFQDIAPVLTNRVAHQSFLNPYDISELRDFNVIAIVVFIVGSVLNRGAFIGNDTSGAGRTPHEQKMAGVLGAWRNALSTVALLLLGIIVIVFMNEPRFLGDKGDFRASNTQVRQNLSAQVLSEVVKDPVQREKALREVRGITLAQEAEKLSRPISNKDNLDTEYYKAVQTGLGTSPEANYQFQQFRSVFQQMMMPAVLRAILPVGMVGMICLLMIMLMVSTDAGRIFNASATLVQDVVLPLCRTRISPEKHLRILRVMTMLVGALFAVFSFFFIQLDYIFMFTTIIGALWCGGAGPVVVLGLYSRFGNLTGAWCAIIFGSGTSLLGLILQRNWALHVYPFLDRMGWVEHADAVLSALSSPFEPWIVWRMDPVKFPINSLEIYLFAMIFSVIAYIAGSYLTYKPFNLDKLLHRGEFAEAGAPEQVSQKWSFRSLFSRLIGITSEYTLGDKFIAWSVFVYSIIYHFGFCFIAIAVFNVFYRWPVEWWSIKFFVVGLIVPGIIAFITAVWFTWGGIVDMRRLFIDLNNEKDRNPEDNGQILKDR